ncbi:aldehyde dehydrogenase family protein [Canibacter zhoujuaniae]|uniref:aldehyde dehydrogenase family protein n=1 Tax=Canibacter zhoujuaniae TaxID=2708343 RepID=UPI0014239B54|nr:aldehyde dehydrogenase family protein [Canibacter zhoujuaniae]
MGNYVSKNPATGEVVAEFPEHSDAEINEAIEKADGAYRSWKFASLSDRAALLQQVSKVFRDRAQELAEVITTEMGKPITQALGEVEIVARIFEYYAVNLEKFLADELIETALAGKAFIRAEAIGVLLGIMPWNFPYYQIARFAAPNIGLGNTILIKHARNCPRTALAFESVMREAGAPEGVYTNIFASNEQVAQMLAHDAVRAVSLTGSERAGAAVAEAAGRNLKKCVLELGGSDPFIVCASADPQQAAAAAAEGRLRNAGQVCTSSKRFFAHADIYDEFVRELKQEFSEWVPSDPLSPNTKIGSLSSATALADVDELVQDAVSKGATVLVAGGHCDVPEFLDGSFYQPIVLTDVTEDMRIFREEVFGPVAVLHRFETDEEAIAAANDSPYGLAAAVFTNDDAQWSKFNHRLEVGMVWRNATSKSAPELPFGGVKNSGFGRELSRLGLDEFANKKLIAEP